MEDEDPGSNRENTTMRQKDVRIDDLWEGIGTKQSSKEEETSYERSFVNCSDVPKEDFEHLSKVRAQALLSYNRQTGDLIAKVIMPPAGRSL